LRREQFVLESFRLASHELRPLTDVIAVHFGPSSQKGVIRIVDRLGRRHLLPTGNTAWILQRKKRLLMPELEAAAKAGRREEARRLLQAFVDVVAERGKQGVINRDPSFLLNYGYDGEKGYLIDLGDFFRKPNQSYQDALIESVRSTLNPVRAWLKKINPVLCSDLDAMAEKVCP
jgi:hypothetical protein